MSKFWKKTIFWENLKKSCAIFGGPTVVGFHMFDAADIYVCLSGITAMMGAFVSIWMTDNDKDGIIDLFENDDNNPS